MNFNYCRKVPVDKTRHRLRKVRDKALTRHSVYKFKRHDEIKNLAFLIAVHDIGQLQRCIYVYRKVINST